MNITQVYKRFPAEEDCIDHLEAVRWANVPTCPYCNSTNSSPQKDGKRRHHCNNCNTSYSVTVGTIFHHTHLDLQKWFLAVSLILNAKKGISSRQLSRDLEVNKDTAWRISVKIREAMSQTHQRELLTGLVEMDETYIGGKPGKGGPGGPAKRGRGTDKTPVVGMVERGGNVKANVSKKGDLNAKKLSALVRSHVDVKNAVLMTGEYQGHIRIKTFMPHETINHKVWYVDGDIHTNTIESFWAILKRGIVGQSHKVSVKHLSKYPDEFCYRYNNRKHIDLFGATISRGLGVNQ